MKLRGRAHAGLKEERLHALEQSHTRLAQAFGRKDRSVRALAKRRAQYAEKLLASQIAARVHRAKVDVFAHKEAKEPPFRLVIRTAEAQLQAGNLKRAEDLAVLALLSWHRFGRHVEVSTPRTLELLAQVAHQRGNHSLAEAIRSTPDADYWTTNDAIRDDLWK